jgi:DNA repair protein SbcD/Mre11
MKFLFRTDVHVADKSPASWKADYAEEIWSSLEQIGGMARKYKVNAVLDGGDYFHVKASTRNSHSLVARSAEIQANYPCQTYVVPGNHDIAYNNLDSLDGQQPLRVLFASQVFQRLGEMWIQEGDFKTRVVGVPYNPRRSLEDLQAIQKGDEDRLIAVVHALAAEDPPPEAEDFMGEPIFRYADMVTEGGPDIWLFGHWHKDQGSVQVGGKYFINPGSVSRGALVKENLSRIPQVVLIELTPDEIMVGMVPLQVAPAKDVFDIERKERREKEGEIISQFVDKLRQDVAVDTSADIETSIHGLDFAADVRDLALEYLERARSRS